MKGGFLGVEFKSPWPPNAQPYREIAAVYGITEYDYDRNDTPSSRDEQETASVGSSKALQPKSIMSKIVERNKDFLSASRRKQRKTNKVALAW